MRSFTVSSSQAFDDLAKNRIEKRGSRTLLAATQAFVTMPLHDRRSSKQYNELFRHFFPKTNLDDRQAIARLIATNTDVPEEVLLLLCCDEESVACQILQNSPLLDEETLITQILQGTTLKRQAIANRQDINFNLASQLISFSETSVLMDLEQHIDRLPEIAARLHDILGAESEMAELQQGSTAMEPNDPDYDKLVSDMERDWYEHYHPEELVAAEERMLSATDDALADAIEKPHGISACASEKASSATTSTQDDRDPEAEFEEEASPKRFSFSIFAEDEGNAPIPPLETNDQDVRSASIQFKKALEQEEQAELSAHEFKPNSLSEQDNNQGTPATSLEETTSPVSHEEEHQQSRSRITFEIRASKADEETIMPSSDTEILPARTSLQTQDRSENPQLGPAPAPFVPRAIPQTASDDDWQQALAHLSKPADEKAKAQTRFGVRSPADRGTSAKRERTALPQVAPQADTHSKPAMPAEATVSFTRMQSAPITLKAPSQPIVETGKGKEPVASLDIKQQERDARIKLPAGPSQSGNVDSKFDMPVTPTPQQVSAGTQQTFADRASLPEVVLKHTIFDASQIRECVLVENPEPNAETVESFANKAALAKPELLTAHLENKVPQGVQLPAQDTLDAFAQKADLGRPDVSALLSDLSMIEPPQLKTGIPEALCATTMQTDAVAQTPRDRAADLSKLGFMPSMIDLEELDLVEAIPDMPSASEAMMDQIERATPAIELVEPIELYFADDETADAKSTSSPMMVVAAQIEAEREKTTLALDDERVLSDVSVISEEVDATTNPVLQVQAEAQAQQEETFQQEAAKVHISIRRKQVDELLNEAGDLTDLPELSHHQIVEAEDLVALKTEEQAIDVCTDSVASSRTISVSLRPAARQTGSMDQFLAFDEETRLAILQSLISATVPMDRAERFQRWPQGRPQLAEKQSSALLMARFASDNDSVAQVMHEISGHPKSDMAKLLQDAGGEALIAYLASIGLDESRALSMVLHAPDSLSHSYDKVSKLMTLFDQMHPAACITIVEQLLGALSGKDSTQAEHIALHDDGYGAYAPRLRTDRGRSETTTEREPTITFGRRNSGKN